MDSARQGATTDIAALPRHIAIRILHYAYLHDDTGKKSLKWYVERFGTHPLRTVAPLVCKKWAELLKSEEAQRVLWGQVYIEDASINGFNSERFHKFWTEGASRVRHIRELEICLRGPATTNCRISFSAALTRLLGFATALKSLRLGGNTSIGGVFTSLSPKLSSLQSLSSIYIAREGEDPYDFASGVRELSNLPNLQKLEIKFSNDVEVVSPDLLHSVADLTRLRHLSLQWPLRSAIPPADDVPTNFSQLTGLSTLKLRRVQLQDPSPLWITALFSLRHLYWDPFLPVDVAGTIPASLAVMPQLKTLYIDMLPPLAIPSSLTSLERLIVVNRGAPATLSILEEDKMEWLGGMSNLVSLRLQGGRLRCLPETVRRLTGLTRVGLMCNDLTEDSLYEGPWVLKLKHLHLGANRIGRFPPALWAATDLKTLHLANQHSVEPTSRPLGEDKSRVSFMPQHMVLSAEDVASIISLPSLQIIVMGMHQPVVQLGTCQRGFEWLQKVLRQRERDAGGAVRLTSNELAYTLEPLDVFDVRYEEESFGGAVVG